MANQNTPNFIFNKSRFSHLRSSEDLLNVADLSRSFVFAEQLLSSQVPALSATSLTESNLNSLYLNSGTPEFISVASTNTGQGHIFQCRSIKLTKRTGSNPAMYEVSTSPSQNLAGTTPAVPVDLNKIIENYDNYTFRVFSDTQIDLSNCPFTFVVRAGHLICLADGVPNNTSAMIKNIGNTTNADTLYLNCYIYNGNVGTNQFLGYTGPQGATGTSGSNGANGATGPQGSTGAGFNMTSYSSHLIPSQNSTYDIGSAEYKVRHLYLSSNSLWLGDEHKITVSSGEMKFRRRNKNRVPKAIADVDGGQTTSAANVEGYFPGKTVEQLTLKDWDLYAQTKGLTFEDLFIDDEDDFDRSHDSGGATGPIGAQGATGIQGSTGPAASNYWSSSTGNVYRSSGKVGVATTTPNESLEVSGNILIDNGNSSVSTQGGRLLFDNAFGKGGPNKIRLQGESYGFGVDTNTMKYLTGGTDHKWSYSSSGTTNGTLGMTLSSSNLTVVGSVSASSFDGDGSSLTSLAWSNLTGLPTASTSTLGLIKIGYTESGKNYPIELDADNKAYVNVPWTDTDTTYSTASSSALGLIKIGYTESGKNYPIELDADNKAYVNVPWTDTDTNTTYSTATSSTLGLIKIGYTESGKNYPVELSSGKAYVNVPWTDTNTTYSTATSSTLGLIKIGYTESGKNYPIELDADNKAYVNVPWTDTDTNTTYSTASSSALGLIKIGYSESGKNYPVELDANNKAYVNVPWTDTDTNTTYSTATSSTLGLIKIGYTESGKNYPVELSSGKAYVNVPWTDTNTTYSTASSNALGLIKIGYSESGKNYPVELDANNKAYVNVPWTDTNTNTTYSTATSSTLGLIKIGYTESGKNYPVELSSGKAYVNVPWTDTNTTYSTATSSTLGLIKIGYTESGKNYPVELDGNNKAYVNVPWTDTNTSNWSTSGNNYTTGKLAIGITSPGTQLHSIMTGNGNTIPDTGINDSCHTALGVMGSTPYGLAIGTFESSGDSWIQAKRFTNGDKFKLLLNPDGGNIGIGTTNPGALLQIGSGYKVGDQNSKTVNRGWYRIAQVGTQETASSGSIRSGAVFTLRDTRSSGGHSHLKMIVGMTYGSDHTASLTVLSHSYYGTRTFTQARLVYKGTYDAIYLEVYVHSASATNIPVSYVIENNAHADDWIPLDWTAGSIPSGFSSNTFSLEVNFSVCSDTQDFVVSNEGRVGIGTTAGSHEILDINGWIGRTSHHNGALCGGHTNIASNNSKTSPIYVIGSNYKPNEDTLNNMYGIGYTHTDSTFVLNSSGSWGLYVAADGDARIFLAASASGSTYFNAKNFGIGTTSPHTKLEIMGGPLLFHSSIYNSSATSSNGVESEFIAFGGVSATEHIEYGMYMGLRKPDAVATASSVRLQIGQLDSYDTAKAASHADNTDRFTPRLTIMRTGNLGIGTDDPSYLLDLQKSGSDNYIRVQGGGTAGNFSGIFLTEHNNTYGWIIRNDCETDKLHISHSNSSATITDKIAVQVNGNVGIGTSSPDFPLHISGKQTGPGGSGRYFKEDSSSIFTKSPLQFDTSLYASHMIVSDTYVATTSDERIKTEIEDVSDNIALEKIRNIPCRYYHYKDQLRKESEKTIGFISQEVKEVFPQAVRNITGYIPCFQMLLQDYTWTERIENTSDSSKNSIVYDLSINQLLDLSTNEPLDCSGINYRFYVSNDPSGNDEKELDIIGNSNNTFTFDSSYNNIFLWGKQVNDYLVLDKQKIFSLHHSAMQEIDRQQQADKAEIAILKNKVSLLENENASMKQQINDILSRLSALEG